jgi:hypothetical protein
MAEPLKVLHTPRAYKVAPLAAEQAGATLTQKSGLALRPLAYDPAAYPIVHNHADEDCLFVGAIMFFDLHMRYTLSSPSVHRRQRLVRLLIFPLELAKEPALTSMAFCPHILLAFSDIFPQFHVSTGC